MSKVKLLNEGLWEIEYVNEVYTIHPTVDRVSIKDSKGRLLDEDDVVYQRLLFLWSKALEDRVIVKDDLSIMDKEN
jgi:hypothetical protein